MAHLNNAENTSAATTLEISSKDTTFGANDNPYVDAAVTYINTQVSAQAASQAEAMGKVYQAVSQSMSLAVQDATDNLRSFSTVNLAALSYAQEQLVATKDANTWTPIITELQTALTSQIAAFASLGADAGKILQTFVKNGGGSTTSTAPRSRPSSPPESPQNSSADFYPEGPLSPAPMTVTPNTAVNPAVIADPVVTNDTVSPVSGTIQPDITQSPT